MGGHQMFVSPPTCKSILPVFIQLPGLFPLDLSCFLYFCGPFSLPFILFFLSFPCFTWLAILETPPSLPPWFYAYLAASLNSSSPANGSRCIYCFAFCDVIPAHSIIASNFITTTAKSLTVIDVKNYLCSPFHGRCKSWVQLIGWVLPAPFFSGLAPERDVCCPAGQLWH